MKFENPIMNISMFEVENVVTTSGGEDQPKVNAEAKAMTALTGEGGKGVSADNVLSFEF